MAKRLFTLRIRHRGHPGQDLRPDLRCGARRDPEKNLNRACIYRTGLVHYHGEITTSCYVGWPTARSTASTATPAALLRTSTSSTAIIAMGVDNSFEMSERRERALDNGAGGDDTLTPRTETRSSCRHAISLSQDGKEADRRAQGLSIISAVVLPARAGVTLSRSSCAT